MKAVDASVETPPGQAGLLSDLLPRTLSALVLIPCGLAAAWAGGPWMAGLAGAAALAMSYEWARMSEPEALTPAFLFALVGSMGAVMYASWSHLDWGLAWLVGCAALSALRRRSLAGVLETAGGAIYVGAPAALFLWLREHEPGGFQLIILLFASIWAADVAAYFAGRLIGGPKLMSWLSPQKTWVGLCAGVACGTLAAAAAAVVFDTPVVIWGAAGAGFALVGLMGDLFESFLKRRFGVKDASHIIPGHGGVLDRLDGLMAATFFAAGLAALWPGLLAVLQGAS